MIVIHVTLPKAVTHIILELLQGFSSKILFMTHYQPNTKAPMIKSYLSYSFHFRVFDSALLIVTLARACLCHVCLPQRMTPPTARSDTRRRGFLKGGRVSNTRMRICAAQE